ncbi:MAG: hypothetical protein ACLPZY_11870 [Terracidiphilus sp.]
MTTPTGVAVDGSGDVFIADSGAGRVYKLPKPSAASCRPVVPRPLTSVTWPVVFKPLGPKGTSYTLPAPLSAIKTSPEPSTATPVGVVNPVPRETTVDEPTAYIRTLAWPGSAI